MLKCFTLDDFIEFTTLQKSRLLDKRYIVRFRCQMSWRKSKYSEQFIHKKRLFNYKGWYSKQLTYYNNKQTIIKYLIEQENSQLKNEFDNSDNKLFVTNSEVVKHKHIIIIITGITAAFWPEGAHGSIHKNTHLYI